jgi:hypothetical protein
MALVSLPEFCAAVRVLRWVVAPVVGGDRAVTEASGSSLRELTGQFTEFNHIYISRVALVD